MRVCICIGYLYKNINIMFTDYVCYCKNNVCHCNTSMSVIVYFHVSVVVHIHGSVQKISNILLDKASRLVVCTSAVHNLSISQDHSSNDI